VADGHPKNEPCTGNSVRIPNKLPPINLGMTATQGIPGRVDGVDPIWGGQPKSFIIKEGGREKIRRHTILKVQQMGRISNGPVPMISMNNATHWLVIFLTRKCHFSGLKKWQKNSGTKKA